ncbi:MAG: transketolase family protein [Methylovirgula sp.]
MRATLSSLLIQAAQADPNVLVLTGDHGYALFDELRRQHPNQYLNCGVAEQNMVGVAAGLAKSGFLPIVYGLAAFIPIRVLEQIKLDICYEGLPVVLLGDGAGLVYSTLGASHQCFEDVAALRSVPNMSIFSPADRHELTWSFNQARKLNGPAYLRLGKADLGDVHDGPLAEDFDDCLCPVIDHASENLCVATGSMVSIAKHAIEKAGLAYDLYSVPKLKKIDAERILRLCEGRKKIVTAEEHSIYGGLGSAVAEAIAGRISCRFDIVGIRDVFTEDCGSYAHLLVHHGLDELSVLKVLQGDGIGS